MRKLRTSSILAVSLSIALFGSLLPVHAVTAAPVATAVASTMSVYGIQLGMSSAQVAKILGNPVRKDPSTTGVEWWIYNKDLRHYIQVGMQKDKVVTLFSNGL
ncbi:CAP-associated domain-containing protein [Brevibacillus centrosporus]|uniref:CAP-associated domain-containing protein n=1 Tax=Brevibacillus centrosporus TaxID=54910 RepID=UPI003986FBAF